MADYGLAILSGLLGGLQGLPQGMVAGTQLAMRQQALDQDQSLRQQMLDLQRQQHENANQSRFVDLPKNMLPSDYGTQVDQTTGLAKVPTQLAPALIADRRAQMERENQARSGSAIAASLRRAAAGDPYMSALADALEFAPEKAKDVAGVLQGASKERDAARERDFNRGLMEWAAAGADPARLQEFTSRPPAAQAPTAAVAPGQPMRFQPVAAQGGDINPRLPLGQQPSVQAAGKDLSEAVGNLATAAKQLPGAPAGAPAPAAPPASGRPGYKPPTLSFGKSGLNVTMSPTGEPSVGAEYVKAERDLQALEDAGVPETDPRWQRAARHLDRLKPQVVQEGGGIGGPSGGTPIRTPLPGRTPEAQLKDFSTIDLARGQLNELTRLAPKVNLAGISGGMAPWVNSILQTGKVGPIPIPPNVAGQLTPDQNRFLAILQDYADQVLRMRSGAQINEQEFRRMLGFLASPDVRPDVLMSRLKLQQDYLRAKRRSLETTLQGAGYRVPAENVPSFSEEPTLGQTPAAPSAPPQEPGMLQRVLPFLFGTQPQQAPSQRWGRDAQGRPVPLQ